MAQGKFNPQYCHRSAVLIIQFLFLKKIFKYILGIVLLATAGGIVWWQLNKKGFIRNRIEKAVSRGTDSTYYIHYDSSRIEELAGNATFYNLVLQSDSLQQQLYTDDTADIAKTIFNVHIEKLAVIGANIPAFLQKNKVQARIIEITRPVITLINTGRDEAVKFTAEDTLALYEKLTGKFNSIQAGQIKIIDGTIAFAKGKKSPHATLQGVNIDFRDLKIDSTRNYDNLISYFVKGIVADVKSVNVKNEKANRLFVFEGVQYNAPGRFLKIDKFLQTDTKANTTMIALSNTRVSGLSTNAFIVYKTVKADSLTTDGGALSFYRGKKAGSSTTTESIDIDNEFFDEAIVKNIRLGSTTLTLLDKANKNAPPFVLKNLKFNASGIDSAYTGTDILELIGKSNWDLSADGISFNTKDKVYKIDIGPFLLDNFHSVVTVKSAAIIQIVTQDAFVKSLKFQKDLYNLHFANIRLSGVDVKKLLTDRAVIAEDAFMNVNLNIFNDRTVTPDTASKIGQYPQQLLQKLKIPVYIKSVHAPDAYVRYTERGALSKKTGDVIFSKIQGEIKNFTNINSYIKKNNVMTLTANCIFLNMAAITSSWKLALNSPNGEFALTGKVGPFNGTKLNPVIEPLGMGSIRSGNISSYTFSMKGTDLRADGDCILLYDNLKIKLLKNTGDSNELKKKGVTSLVANLFIKDKNDAANPRRGDMGFKRVTTKTFFNLVWKSIFAGAKSSTR